MNNTINTLTNGDFEVTHEERIGYCEGLCGGQLDHHLVDGLCPRCRADAHIETIDVSEISKEVA